MAQADPDGYALVMHLRKALQRWVDATLLTETQAARIAAFEQTRRRPLARRALAGLGALAVVLGMLSLVASHWNAMAGRSKIAAALVGLAVLGYGLWHCERRAWRWPTESVAVLLGGLVLANIALIGQVYQQHGEVHLSLGLWLLLVLPLMGRAYSLPASLFWLLGLHAVYIAWLTWWYDHFSALGALGATYWGPLIHLCLGHALWLRRSRPVMARLWRLLGWGALLLGASLGTWGFEYHAGSRSPAPLWATFAVSVGLGTVLWWQRYKPHQARLEALLPLLCVCGAYLPSLFSFSSLHATWLPGSADKAALSVLTFVGLWACVGGWAWHFQHWRLFHLATALVGLRLFWVYIEVVGSLLDTGLALLGGGIVVLALLWLWQRYRPWLRAAQHTSSHTEAAAPIREMPLSMQTPATPHHAKPWWDSGRQWWTWTAVGLPLLALILWTGHLEYRLHTALRWEIPIEGFDPRDLLHGHYVRYRYRFQRQGKDTCNQGHCCLCLTRSHNAGFDPLTRRVHCNQVSHCEGWLATRFHQGPQRYFVPEAKARSLSQALRNRQATIVLRQHRDGQATATALSIDRRPWHVSL